VLELHSAPGGQTSYFISDPEAVLLWDSPQAQDRTVALWRSIARRYQGRSVVAGYDLLGEPMPPRNEDLVPLYRRIITAIREVDTHHLLILEGTDFARNFSMFTGPLDPNQIWSFHMYTWFGDDRQRRLRGFAAIAAAQGVPMWCGEFGENTLPMLATTLDLFDAQSPGLVGWSFWTWKRALPSGWATWHGFSPTPRWERLINWAVNDKGERPSPEDSRAAMEEFLGAADFAHVTTDPALEAALSAHAREHK
jgi:endoglucanase